MPVDVMKMQRDIDELNRKVDKLLDITSKIRNAPEIHGFASKALKLNENIDAVLLMKKINDDIAALNAHIGLTETAHGGMDRFDESLMLMGG